MKRLIVLVFLFLCAYGVKAQEICNNGLDDDNDGFIDCFDKDCTSSSLCDGYYLGNDVICQAKPTSFPSFSMKLKWSSPNKTTNHLNRATVGDLNRDGVPEVLVTEIQNNVINVLDGKTGSLKKSLKVSYEIDREVVVGNLNNDACAEVFVSGSITTKVGKKNVTNYYIFSYDCNLNALWTSTALSAPAMMFGLADFDGDGKVEIFSRDEILDASTGIRIVKGTDSDNTVGAPVAVDILNNDNKLELVAGCKIFEVNLGARTLDVGNLVLKKSVPSFFIRQSHSSTSIADYNLDGSLDVIASGSDGSQNANTTIFFWDVKTDVVKKYIDKIAGDIFIAGCSNTTGKYYENGWQNGTGRVNIADIDGDGKLNASYVSGKYLYALKEDFTLKWRVSVNEETSGYTGCSVYDFNGDGAAEVVYRDEQYLYIINGKDGSVNTQQQCIARTQVEYPIVADIDGDGSTELCVTCGFDDKLAWDNFCTLSYSENSHVRVFQSASLPWVPSRKLWNQHAYFNVNVNDDLTIPKIQQKHHLVFSTGTCTQGPNRPLNTFLNQTPYLDTNGCPTYASPDLVNVQALFKIQPPTCPGNDFTVTVGVKNQGDVTIAGDVPITFYNGDPTKAGATKLNTVTIPVNLATNTTATFTNLKVTGTGGSFKLFISLNDAGTSLPTPIKLPNTTFLECNYDNVISADVVPKSVKLTALKVNDNVKCIGATVPDNGAARAFISVAGVENTTDYDFFWYNGPVVGVQNFKGAVYSGLAAGTYKVFARHKTALCNSDTATVVINRVDKTMTASIVVDKPNTSCSIPNGEMHAVVNGGDPVINFTFKWYEGNDIFTSPEVGVGSIAKNLKGGKTYTVLVTDIASGCQAVASLPVPDNTTAPTLTASKVDAVCVPVNSGSASANVGGVTTGFTFRWYNGTATKPAADFTGAAYNTIPAGSYTVTAENTTTGCVSAPTTVVVGLPPSFAVTASMVAQQTSCLTPNGSATANVGGVTAGFTFDWFSGQTTAPGNAITGPTALAAGTYTVRATKTSTGCTDTEEVTITQSQIFPVVTLTPTPNSTCSPTLGTSAFNGAVTGTVKYNGVTVTDFTNYQLTWHNGALTTDPTIAGATTPNLSQLNGGSYTLEVKRTDLGCAATPVTAVVTNTLTLPVLTTSQTPSKNCVPGKEDGIAEVTQVNGTAVGSTTNFNYQWHTGTTTATPIASATNAKLQNVQGGATSNYTVLVTNKTTGCQNTATVLVADAKAVPTVTLAAQNNTICDPALTSPVKNYNGKVTATVTNQVGALTDYNFTFGGGNTTTPVALQSANIFDRLNGGPTAYTVIATHTITGCVSAQANATVANVQDLPDLVTDDDASTNCVGGTADGAAKLMSVDAVAPAPASGYSYSWNAGTTVALPVLGTGSTLSNVQGGTSSNYTVQVTNLSNGCRATATVLVADAKQNPVLSLTSTPNTGCTSALTGTASQSALTDTNAKVGDTYSYVWSSGLVIGASIGSSSSITNKNGGFYTATVTNNRTKCTSSPVTVEIVNNQVLPTITTTTTSSTNCVGGAADGAASANVGGTTTGFSFQWYAGNAITDPQVPALNGGGTAAISAVSAANYTVQVTNSTTGCANTKTVIVADGKQNPVLTLTSSPNSGCTAGLFTGSASQNTLTDANAKVGDTYSYVWSSGLVIGASIGSASGITNKDGGFYTATATNNRTNCTSSPVTVEIVNNKALPTITTATTASTNCAGGSVDGTASANVGGVTAGFSFQWYAGNAITDPQVPALNGGGSPAISSVAAANYTVQVTNSTSGCANTKTVIVADGKQNPVLTLTSSPNTGCTAGLFTGSASQSSLTDANAKVGDTYSYVWSSGLVIGVSIGSGSGIVNKDGGFYTATVTNSRTNCTSTPVTVEIVNNKTLPTITTTTTASTNCVGGTSDGAASANVGGVTAGFSFQWYAGNAITDPQVPALNGGGSPAISSVAAANYTVQVINSASGCENTKTVVVIDGKQNPVFTLTSSPNGGCTVGLFTGTASQNTLTDTNAKVGDTYSYVWSAGNVIGADIGTGASSIVNKDGGFYTATVTNTRTKCTSSPVTVEIINNKVLPSITATTTPSTNCAGGTLDGAASANVGGTTIGFSFQWYAGNAITDPQVPALNGGGSPSISAVASANYTVQVISTATGCENTKTVTIADGKQNPVLTLTSSPNVGCAVGLFTGTASQNTLTDANAKVGDTYTYIWSAGSVIGADIGTGTSSIVNKNGGFYTANVKNNRTNCTSADVTVSIANNITLPVLAMSATGSTNCDPTKDNGAATLTTVDAAAPNATTHTFQWYNGTSAAIGNIRAGDTGVSIGSTTPGLGIQGGLSSNFTVLVTKISTGCQNTALVNIPDSKTNPVLNINLLTNNTICVGTKNGSLKAEVTYGIPPVVQASPLAANWQVTWMPGAITGETLSSLGAGTYSATVTDSNTGCTSGSDSETVVDVLEFPTITTSILHEQTACPPAGGNGQLRGSATTTSGTLQFTWYTGVGTGGVQLIQSVSQVSAATLSTAANLASTNYTFNAKNELTGCESNKVVLLPQTLTYPTFTGALTDVTQCVPTNGKIDITLGTITNPSDFTIYYLNEVNGAHTGDPTTIKSSATVSYNDDPSKLSYTGLFSGPAPGDHDLEPGTYTVLLVDGVTQCESNPTTFTLKDLTNKSIAVTAIAEASACNSGVGGSIDISVSPAIPYTYTWHSGVPTNTGFNFMNNANLPAFAGGDPVSQTTEDLTGYTPGDFAGVGNGLYTVVVIDGTGCGKVFTEAVPYLESPAISLTLMNSTKCDPALSDASIQVDITPTVAVPVGTRYSVQLFKGHNSSIPLTFINGEDDGCNDGIDNDGDGDIDTADTDCGDDGAPFSTAFSATSPILPVNPTPVQPLLGNYLVRVFDNAGSGCAIEKAITLEIDPKLPVVDVGTIVANTACSPAFGDGTATITVDKDPLDVSRAAPTAIGSNVFLGTYASNPSYSITAITPNPVAGVFPGQALVTGTPTLIAATFASQLYTVTVTDAVSGCEVDQAINIPSNQGIPGTFTVATAADEFCSPSTNGSATVTAIDLASDPTDDATDYNFQWFNDAGLTTLVVPVVNPGNGLGTGGELLNSTKVTAAALWPVNATAGLGNGSKTFYARAQKLNAPGNRCFTAVQQVDILDDHTVPVATIVPFSNTSCNVAVDEGKIELTAETNSGNATIDAADYTYTWSADPTGNSPVTAQDGTVTYTINPLPNATYTVTTTNEISGCIATNTTEILNIPYTVNITDFIAADQQLCPIGGQIDVTEVTINRGNTGLSSIATPGTGTLAADYTFEWFTSLPGDPGSFDDTTPLEDNATNPIVGASLVAGSGAGQYSTMGFGTYYVIATRTNTAVLPAANCPSVPFRVDLQDKRIFPTVSFATVSNSSCDNNFDGRITVTASTSSGPGVGANYNFVWTDPDAGGPISVANAMNQSSPYATPNTDRIDGSTYAVQVTNVVTGCSTNANVSVADTTLPMVITSVTPTHVDLCGPGNTSASNGQGTIVDVLLNSVSRPGSFTFTWSNNPAFAGGVATNNPPLNHTGLAIGTHYVRGLRTAIALNGPGSLGFGSNGSGCSTAPANFDVLDKRVYPTVGFATVSNSSCDTNFDGRITVTATTASGPGAGATYDLSWTDPDGGLALYSVANTTNQSSPYATPTSDRIGSGTYTVQVTNRTTTCFTNADVSVVNKTLPMVITSVTPTHVDLCGPGNTSASNGQGTIVDVLLDNVSRPGSFTFTWANNAAFTGGVATNNPPLNHTGLAIGTHYVRGLRTAIALDGPGSLGFGSNGSGCSTAPANFDVLDKRVYPTVGFTTVSNSSCDTNFDGRITVTATTASGPGAGSTYDLSWTDPDGGLAVYSVANTTNQSSPYATPTSDRIGSGTYTVQVTNRTTTCFTNADVAVANKTLPMVITSVTPTHVDLCGPGNSAASNGQGTIVDVLLNSVSRPGSFTFTWANNAAFTGGVATNNPPLNHTGLAIGTHYVRGLRTAIALDGPGSLGFGSNGSGCSTAPANFDVLDKRVYPTVGFTTVSNTSCDTNFDGRITVTATTASGPGAGATYDLAWTDPDGGLAVYSVANVTNQTSPYATPTTDRIGSGTYTVQVTNRTTTCFRNADVAVVNKTLPMVITSVTPTHVDLCGPGNTSASNGQGTIVDVLLNSVSRPGSFTFTWANNPALAGGVATNNPPLNHTGLAIGTHYVQGLRTAIALDGPGSLGFGSNGSGCSTAPANFTVLDKRVYPTVGFTTVSNSSCDNNFDGRITVTATTASGPGAGATYDLSWTDPDGGLAVYSVANVTNQASPYATPTSDRIGSGTYTVQVTNRTTTCFTNADVAVVNKTLPMVITSVTPTHVDLCGPGNSAASNGQGTIVDVLLDNVSRPSSFTFTWANNPSLTGGVATNNPPLNHTGLSVGTYYVQGLRTAIALNGPGSLGFGSNGSGCTTAPASFDVLDKRVFPSVVLTSTPNTACDTNFDGRITITASTTSGPGTGSNYDLAWTDPDGTGPITLSDALNQTSPYTTPLTDRVGANDNYQVRVTNRTTSCFTDATTKVITNPPLLTLTATGVDQDVCLPDGRIDVATVSSGSVANYTYSWFLNSATSSALTDASSTLITGSALQAGNGAGQYPTMGAGTYFVRGTKVPGANPGSGCTTAPFRVEIKDIHVDPVIPAATVNPDVFCAGGAGAGSITLLATSPLNFTYSWFAGNDITGTPVTSVSGVNGEIAQNLQEGAYTVQVRETATNCTSISHYTIANNPLIAAFDASGFAAPPITSCDITTGQPLNGSATVSSIRENGAAQPLTNYTFQWTNNASAVLQTGASPILNNIPAGTYFVKATHGISNCTAQLEFEIEDQTIGSTTVTLVDFDEPERCVDPKVGYMTVLGGGNGASYSYEWFTGDQRPTPAGTPVAVGATLNSITVPSGQTAVTFSVKTINDTNHCWAVDAFDVPLIVNPVILNASANPLTFCTSDNGEVFATIVNDNKFEYDFGWSNGATAKATPDFTGNNVGNLAAGTYTVVATDRADTGCVSPSVTVVIDNMQVIPVVSARVLKALTICDPARPDGVAAADVGGDITRYTFDWFAGAAATGTPFYRGAEVGSLSASTFSVLATETLTGCSASASVIVPTNFAAIPKPTIVVVSNVTSCLADNGELSASVDGVTKDYIFDWANGTTAPPPIAFTGEFYKDLSVGQYTVIATSRITGCVSPPATAPIIKDQKIPDFDFLVQNASCSLANGFITLLFDNDVSIDKVTWSQNGSLVAEGPNLENAFAGFYDVTVQTTLGCENTKEVELPVDILVYNGVSRLEDGKNDIFLIECIENFPNNHVEIFNRAGTKVYEADGYNNTDVLFDGKSNKGISLMGTNLPSGTYFYVISKGDGSERIVGYLELVD